MSRICWRGGGIGRRASFEGVVKIVSWEFESPPLHIEFEVSRYLLSKCGNSSVGRARPCQGRGREFEPRLPLFFLEKHT